VDSLRIAVLFYEERTGPAPARDEVVDQVYAALTALGHQPVLLGTNNDVAELVTRLGEIKPDLVFNLCESFGGLDSNEGNITALLALLGIPFTGTGPVGMALRQDKALTKKVLQFHGVNCPGFAIFDIGNLEFSGRMHFPLIVKPMRGDASLGISDASLVRDYAGLIRQITIMHNEHFDAALVEEYIEGREFYVGVLGNESPEALPLVEMDFSRLPPDAPRIYGRAAKFDATSTQYQALNAIIATDLSSELRHSLANAALEAVYALQVRDYARVDIRLSREGKPYVIEVNANPYLEQTSAFAFSALQAGMGYNTLIGRLVEIAWTCARDRAWDKGMACPVKRPPPEKPL